MKRKTEKEDIRVAMAMETDGKQARGRPKLRWQDTVRTQWQKKEERA